MVYFWCQTTNQTRYKMAKAKAKKKSKEDLWMETMNKLTNWQRTKWQRAGRPGLREKNVKELRKWQNLKHWKVVLREQQSKEA